MHCLTLFVRGSPQPVMLHYRDETAASKAYAEGLSRTPGDVKLIADDFGRFLTVKPDDISYVLLQDVSRASESDTEMRLIQARANAQLQIKANSDPEIRAAAQMMAPQPGQFGRPGLIS